MNVPEKYKRLYREGVTLLKGDHFSINDFKKMIIDNVPPELAELVENNITAIETKFIVIDQIKSNRLGIKIFPVIQYKKLVAVSIKYYIKGDDIDYVSDNAAKAIAVFYGAEPPKV